MASFERPSAWGDTAARPRDTADDDATPELPTATEQAMAQRILMRAGVALAAGGAAIAGAAAKAESAPLGGARAEVIRGVRLVDGRIVPAAPDTGRAHPVITLPPRPTVARSTPLVDGTRAPAQQRIYDLP